MFGVEQKRKNVAEQREAFKKLQQELDPKKLVFLDETWAKTNMTPLRDWAPKSKRLADYAPHGHWKTTTYLEYALGGGSHKTVGIIRQAACQA